MSETALGRLIALEGVDGSGKSTQARLLADELGALLTFEPGGTTFGEALRTMLLDPSSPDRHPRAEALLMLADRAQHVAELIRPALDSGRWVVTDRFSASTLAYQGYGRGLPLDGLRGLTAWATEGTAPDLTVLVDVPVGVARERLRAGAPDRLEQLSDGFYARVASGYRELASADPAHWVVVDGTAPRDAVAVAVLAEVRGRLGPAPSAA